MDDDLTTLWRNDDEPGPQVDVRGIRKSNRTFRRQIALRNGVELFAAGVVVAWFGARAVATDDPWAALAFGLCSLGGLIVGGLIWWRGDSPEAEPEDSLAAFVDEHRAALLYQARLLETVPLWYIGPLLPGLGLLLFLRTPAPGEDGFGTGLMVIACNIAFLAFVIAINRSAARQMRRKAEALPEWS